MSAPTSSRTRPPITISLHDRQTLIISASSTTGSQAKKRRIEAMIETMDSVDERFSLDLMLVKAEKGDAYYEHLEEIDGGQTQCDDPQPCSDAPDR